MAVSWTRRATNLILGAALILSTAAARPPAPGSEVDRALVAPGFTWRSLADAGVRLYYQPGSFAERHRVMLLRSAQAALARGLAFLEMKPDGRELRVIYVDDRGQMQRLIGHRYTGYSDWTGHGVLLVCNAGWRSFDTHEITHVLAMGRWGPPNAHSEWMREGLPVAVDGWCETADIDRIAGYLVSAGRWPGLAAFMANASALGEVPGGVLAGSLIRHLRARYGARVVENCWRSGLEAALRARKVEPASVEAEWLASLRQLARPLSEEEWRRLEAGGCG